MPKDSPEGEKNLARVRELVARIAELPYPPVWVGEGSQAFIDGGELLARAPDLLPPHVRASLMDEVATIRLAREGAVPLLRSWSLLFVPMADVSAEEPVPTEDAKGPEQAPERRSWWSRWFGG